MASVPSLSNILAEAQSIEELQIPHNTVVDILLRLLHSEGNVAFRRILQVLKIPGVVQKILDWLRQEHLVEIASTSQSQGQYAFVYKLTDAGRKRALEALERSQYIGPVPVTIQQYITAVELQTSQARKIRPEDVKAALQDLVLPADFHRLIGPAINSASSLFLYGPSGNGKTTIAQCISNLIGGTQPIWLPFAFLAGGQIIQIHDRLVHTVVKPEVRAANPITSADGRWDLYERPSIVVGGELKLEDLNLRYDPVAKIYEAPLQLKANGGIFLIDDFGRQQVSPLELLNRWIIPLEAGIDYLRLNTGQTLVMPFRELLVFSTNLDPYKLADDAFYRRIQIKVAVKSPDEESFRVIFLRICDQLKIPFNEAAYQHLLNAWYGKTMREMQAVHPRDILKIVVALCQYEGIPLQMTPDLIDEACKSYFVGSG